MNRIYTGKLTHNRYAPVPHKFVYEHACLFTNLDDIEQLCNLSLWVSFEKRNILSFFRQDFLPSDKTLKQEVIDQIRTKTGELFDGKIFLLANWRTMGFAMNPLSLFYCYEDNKLRFVVGEVHNTPWDERHVYVISMAEEPLICTKVFHVSPFMPMHTQYHWTLTPPEESCTVAIRVTNEEEQLFNATLALQGIEVNRTALHQLIRRFPAISIKSVVTIYSQALRLWLKKVPFYPHPDAAERNS